MRGRPSRTLSALDFPLLLFLLSACLAIWPAHDRSLCWPTLAALSSGVALCLVISRLPPAGPLWHAVTAVTILGGVMLAVYFIGQQISFGSALAVEPIPRSGQGFGGGGTGAAGPRVLAGNSVATCLEGLLLLAVAFGASSVRRLPRIAAWLAAGAMVLALVLSASHGAWLAVAVAGGVGGLLRLRRVQARHWAPPVLAAAPLVVGLSACLAIAVGVVPATAGVLGPLLDRPDRFDLYRQTLSLISDTVFTGIGLGGQFAMSLSRYVLLIQVPYLTYSHNLHLEVWLEQGLLGATAWVWLLAAVLCTFAALPRGTGSLRLHAAGLGLLATLLHGIVDARQYADPWCWAPFFVLLGLHSAVVRAGSDAPGRLRCHAAPVATAAVFLCAVLVAATPLGAAWEANLGAVRQAQAELGPPGQSAASVRLLRQAEGHLQRALAIDPRNGTANLRLSLIEMAGERFDEAVAHARAAWEARPGDQAARKALGLASVWAGDVTTALPLLRSLPAIVDELNTWGSWRAGRQQPSLAASAYRTSLLIDPNQPRVRAALAEAERSRVTVGR